MLHPIRFNGLFGFLNKGREICFVSRPSPVVELIERLPSLGLEVSDAGSNPAMTERFLCTRIGYIV